MKRILLVGMMLLSAGYSASFNDFCTGQNRSFSDGERMSFKIYYSLIGIYLEAGSANISLNRENLAGTPVYHMVGEGYSNPRYDWIFKVRDRYESYVDTLSLKPLRFIRNIQEGGYMKYELVNFNHDKKTATTTNGVFTVPGCIQDVVSAVYYARNIDFNSYRVGDKIPFDMFLDNEVYHLYVRYMGREEVKTRYGRFRAIKLKPMLIKGNAFSGGEKMTMWVSDDLNRLPLRIESQISVGSVKIDLMGYSALRHPLTAQISRN